jgi:hypothetical protein
VARGQLVDAVMEAASSKEFITHFGPRKTGKTSLLHHLFTDCHFDEDLIRRYKEISIVPAIGCYAFRQPDLSSTAQMFNKANRQFYQYLRDMLGTKNSETKCNAWNERGIDSNKLNDIFENTWPLIDIDPGLNMAEQVEELISNILGVIPLDQVLFLGFDEVQYIAPEGLSYLNQGVFSKFTQFLRQLALNNDGRIKYILAGDLNLGRLTDQQLEMDRDFALGTHQVRSQFLTSEELAEALTKPYHGYAITYTPQALELAHLATGGLPILGVTIMGSEIHKELGENGKINYYFDDEGGRIVTSNDVESILEAFKDGSEGSDVGLDALYELLLTKDSTTDHRLTAALCAIRREGKMFFDEQEIRTGWNRQHSGTTRPFPKIALEDIVAEGYFLKDRESSLTSGNYTFNAPIFWDYCNRKKQGE